jgi:hypothetical protein
VERRHLQVRKMKQEKLLVSVPYAAKKTGLDERSIRAALESGDIPGKRYGRNWKIPYWWLEQLRTGSAGSPVG